MTIYIAPNCPAEIDVMIRRQAAERGESVMPARPFPWNRRPSTGKRDRKKSLPGQMYLPECDHEPSKLLLQRKADARLVPAKPQLPCDVGLFSDEADQIDLIEMLQDPV